MTELSVKERREIAAVLDYHEISPSDQLNRIMAPVIR
jgi:hypothetical protein